MGGFTAIGSPDVLGLISGAKPVQTFWSDTVVHQTGGITGRHTVVSKVIPAGTIGGPGGVVKFRFDGVASVFPGPGAVTIFFNWGGNDVLSLAMPIAYNGPFFMDVVVTQSGPTTQVVIAKSGETTRPLILAIVGAFADPTQDILVSLIVSQGTVNDQIQLAFSQGQLLNDKGQIE